MVSVQDFNGFLAFVFLMAVPLTAVLSVAVRHLYRKAVSRAMLSVSGAAESEFDVPAPSFPNRSRLEFDVAPLPRRGRLRLGLAARYLAAGLAYSVVLVAIMFVVDGIAFLPIRFGVVVGAFAFTGLVMALYVAGVRWYLFALIAAFWILLLYLIAPESNTVIGLLSLPSLVLALLVANPLLRTTTLPLFLVSVSLVVPLTLSLEVIYLAMERGVLDGLAPYLPARFLAGLYVASGLVLVVGIGIGVALVAVRLIARATAGSSEFMMQHDVVWMFQTIWLVGLGWGTNGPAVLLYVLAFLSYRLVLRLLRPSNEASAVNLHLRVFGQRRTQTRLARGLLLDWRLDGPVLLIGAADLATETLDASELAAFLTRRLDSVFIGTPKDLADALAAGESRLGDGLFPMQDHYCRDNSWRPTVLTLMSRARRVLVDLRGFDPQNRGIRYEIDALAERVPADRITVVVEPDGVEPAKAIFAEAWSTAGKPGGRDVISMRVA